jgi:hypothetical protein
MKMTIFTTGQKALTKLLRNKNTNNQSRTKVCLKSWKVAIKIAPTRETIQKLKIPHKIIK